jgi:hypothetical protein
VIEAANDCTCGAGATLSICTRPNGAEEVYVECPVCAWCGPPLPTSCEAVAAWNRVMVAAPLLARVVKYAVEDRAWTPGATRLARAVLEARRAGFYPLTAAGDIFAKGAKP